VESTIGDGLGLKEIGRRAVATVECLALQQVLADVARNCGSRSDG
jgi:hypothetical protein